MAAPAHDPVLAPSQLHAYTGGASRLEAAGETVDAVLDDLDRRFPGLKFRIIDEQDRIRPHMRLFVGGDAAAICARRCPTATS